MLANWGYLYFHIGQGLGFAEVDLQKYRWAKVPGAAALAPSTIEVGNPIIGALEGHLSTVVTMTQFQDLGTIPRDVEILKAKFAAAKKQALGRFLLTDEIIKDVQRLQNDFRYILDKRKFYSVNPEVLHNYGNPQLFGTVVAKKFPRAQNDIEWAGNCLALGQATACVLHLDRAMEIATRRLATKLRITPNAKDSWGMVLGKMTDPIQKMADDTPAQKRKKEKWAECRTNLYHVKMAWRDPGAHGTQSYDDQQARDILKRVSDFMQQLATLL
jgi:hypothetical protein